MIIDLMYMLLLECRRSFHSSDDDVTFGTPASYLTKGNGNPSSSLANVTRHEIELSMGDTVGPTIPSFSCKDTHGPLD